MAKNKVKWTESMVFQSLRKRFPAGAFTLLPQVRNATGASKQTRTADAIVVSTWPSQGLWLAGIEIKVTRSDWRKEVAEPEKAAEIQKYCRYWNVAAPKGVVPVDEVPENWGLLEIDGRGVNTTKAAPRLECEPPDMLFVAAILRRAGEVMMASDEVERTTRELRERVAEETRKYSDARAEAYELRELANRVEAFEETSGVSINDWHAGNIGRAVRIVHESGMVRCVERATELRNIAACIVRDLGGAMERMEDEDQPL